MNTVVRILKTVIVHCSATPPSMDVGVKEIRQWHTWPRKLREAGGYMFEGKHYEHVDDMPEEVRSQEGNGWTDVGYHFVIRRNGDVENGRDVMTPGAHVAGKNAHSIGVCLVGGTEERNVRKAECNFTVQQWRALEKLVKTLQHRYGPLEVQGHNHYDSGKACPTFNAHHWWHAYGK